MPEPVPRHTGRETRNRTAAAGAARSERDTASLYNTRRQRATSSKSVFNASHKHKARAASAAPAPAWPLHDMFITNVVWCIACKREVGRGLVYCPTRAIVLHQGGQCRWAEGVNGWLIRAQQPRSKRISCLGQAPARTRVSAASLLGPGVPSRLTSNDEATCLSPTKKNRKTPLRAHLCPTATRRFR